MASYRNNGFFGLVDGLNFAVQYQGKNERNDLDHYTKGNDDGFGFSTTYEYEGSALVQLMRNLIVQTCRFGQGKRSRS